MALQPHSLRYLPERFSRLGSRVESALHEILDEVPSFVALNFPAAWPSVAVEATRAQIHFSTCGEPGSIGYVYTIAADGTKLRRLA